MRAVWKYEVVVGTETKHRIPSGGRVVHVDCQPALPGLPTGIVQFWAEVDVTVFHVPRQFVAVGTGQPVEGEYLGTALDGPMVWHLYETTP